MKAAIFFIIAGVALMGCDAQLSKEQRLALKKEMENRKIKKINPEQIYEKALNKGRELITTLDSNNIATLEKDCLCQITLHTDGTSLEGKAQEIFETYQFATTPSDNVQKEGDQWLIYSKPELEGETMTGLWIIRFKKSELVQDL